MDNATMQQRIDRAVAESHRLQIDDDFDRYAAARAAARQFNLDLGPVKDALLSLPSPFSCKCSACLDAYRREHDPNY
jgi:hypothetical protein